MNDKCVIKLDCEENDPTTIARVEHWLERDGKLLAVYVDIYLKPRFAEVSNGKAVPIPVEA